MKLYSTKSNAARGARRLKIANPVIQSDDATGKFFLANAPVEAIETPDLPQGEVQEKASGEVSLKPDSEKSPVKFALPLPDPVFKVPEKANAYRHARKVSPAQSTIDNPVLVCKMFFANNPNMPKHLAIQALVSSGVNFNTAKTQYALYFGKSS